MIDYDDFYGIYQLPLFDEYDDEHKVLPKKIIGCNCIDCSEYYEYAEPNLKDNKFICCGCKIWRSFAE